MDKKKKVIIIGAISAIVIGFGMYFLLRKKEDDILVPAIDDGLLANNPVVPPNNSVTPAPTPKNSSSIELGEIEKKILNDSVQSAEDIATAKMILYNMGMTGAKPSVMVTPEVQKIINSLILASPANYNEGQKSLLK